MKEENDRPMTPHSEVKPINIKGEDVAVLRESLELLNAIEIAEYHNRNWLPTFAIRSPAILNREKRSLIERALKIIGTSSAQLHT